MVVKFRLRRNKDLS